MSSPTTSFPNKGPERRSDAPTVTWQVNGKDLGLWYL